MTTQSSVVEVTTPLYFYNGSDDMACGEFGTASECAKSYLIEDNNNYIIEEDECIVEEEDNEDEDEDNDKDIKEEEGGILSTFNVWFIKNGQKYGHGEPHKTYEAFDGSEAEDMLFSEMFECARSLGKVWPALDAITDLTLSLLDEEERVDFYNEFSGSTATGSDYQQGEQAEDWFERGVATTEMIDIVEEKGMLTKEQANQLRAEA